MIVTVKSDHIINSHFLMRETKNVMDVCFIRQEKKTKTLNKQQRII